MAYEYDYLIANLDGAIGKLPELPQEEQEKLRIGIDHIEKALPLLKSHIEQTEQDPQLDDISTGIGNITIHIYNGDIQEAENEINRTLNLIHTTILNVSDSIYQMVEEIFNKIQNREQEIKKLVKEATYSKDVITAKKEKTEEMEEHTAYIMSGETTKLLAGIFKTRKDELKQRIIVWSKVLLASLVVFIIISIIYIFQIDNITSKVDLINMMVALLLRLAIFIPVSWGVIISSKKLAEAIRLEEGYAHKEAFLTLFDGYKNVIQQIQNINNEEYIGELIDKVLDVASKDPDYIFKSERTTTEKDQDNIKTDENNTEADQVDTDENEETDPKPNN